MLRASLLAILCGSGPVVFHSCQSCQLCGIYDLSGRLSYCTHLGSALLIDERLATSATTRVDVYCISKWLPSGLVVDIHCTGIHPSLGRWVSWNSCPSFLLSSLVLTLISPEQQCFLILHGFRTQGLPFLATSMMAILHCKALATLETLEDAPGP